MCATVRVSQVYGHLSASSQNSSKPQRHRGSRRSEEPIVKANLDRAPPMTTSFGLCAPGSSPRKSASQATELGRVTLQIRRRALAAESTSILSWLVGSSHLRTHATSGNRGPPRCAAARARPSSIGHAEALPVGRRRRDAVTTSSLRRIKLSRSILGLNPMARKCRVLNLLRPPGRLTQTPIAQK